MLTGIADMRRNQEQVVKKLELDVKQQGQTILDLTQQLNTAVRSQTAAQQELETWQQTCGRLEFDSKQHLHICLLSDAVLENVPSCETGTLEDCTSAQCTLIRLKLCLPGCEWVCFNSALATNVLQFDILLLTNR